MKEAVCCREGAVVVGAVVINSWHGCAGSQQAVLLWRGLWCCERAQYLAELSNGNWQMVMTLRAVVETRD
ncbi:unnamed protein product [Lota lota]